MQRPYSLGIFGATADRPAGIISTIHFGTSADRTIRFIGLNRRCTKFIKPPAPRKVETPPAETVVVIGDSFGDWLGYGLEQVFAEKPEIGIVRKIKLDFGLARDDARLDAPEWSQAIKDLLPATEKFNAIVVMLGVNDRLPLRDHPPPTKGTTTASDNDQKATATTEAQHRAPGTAYEFHTDKWAELHSKRIDDMIAALKTRGVPIMWVGLPAIRGAKSTSDMSYLNELFSRASREGRHCLCRHLGRLRRRSGALCTGRAGFRGTNAPAANL